jgi:hypothetical protein
MVIDYINMLENKAYAIAGVSMLSSRSEKPSGLDSGKALQTYNDIESERFVLVGQAYEELHVDVYKRTIDIAQKIAKRDKKFGVLSGSENEGLEKIIWADINVNKDVYQVKAFPSSALPQQPEARYQRLSEMLQGGLITPEEFYDLNDMPDLKTGNDIKYSDYNAIKANLSRIVESKTYIRPSKYDNLTLSKQMALKFKSYLTVRNAPEEIINIVLNLIDDIDILEQQAAGAPLSNNAALSPSVAPQSTGAPQAAGQMQSLQQQAPSNLQSGMQTPPVGVNV